MTGNNIVINGYCPVRCREARHLVTAVLQSSRRQEMFLTYWPSIPRYRTEWKEKTTFIISLVTKSLIIINLLCSFVFLCVSVTLFLYFIYHFYVCPETRGKRKQKFD